MMSSRKDFARKTVTTHSNRVGVPSLPTQCKCGAGFLARHYEGIGLYVLHCPTGRFVKFDNMKGKSG